MLPPCAGGQEQECTCEATGVQSGRRIGRCRAFTGTYDRCFEVSPDRWVCPSFGGSGGGGSGAFWLGGAVACPFLATFGPVAPFIDDEGDVDFEQGLEEGSAKVEIIDCPPYDSGLGRPALPV